MGMGTETRSPLSARADASAVDSVVSALFRIRPKEYSELSSNASAHGLAPPGLKVILNAGDKSSTVNIGDLTFGSNAVAFITTSTRSRPMAVSASDLSALFKDTRGGGKAGDLAKWTNDYRTKSVFSVEDRVGGGADQVDAV